MKKNQETDTPSNMKEYREGILREWAEEADALEVYERYIKFDKSVNRKRIAIIVLSVMMAIMMILTLFFPALVWFVWMFIVFTLFETVDMRIDQLWALRMVDNILDEHKFKKVKELINGKLNNK